MQADTIIGFLSRPIRIASLDRDDFDITMINRFNFINFWYTYPLITEKLSYFKYFRCDFEITFTPIMPAFAYGLLAFSFAFDVQSDDDISIVADPVIWIGSRNTVYQDISTNEIAIMTVPYSYPLPYYDRSQIADKTFPSICFTQISPITSALDGTAPNFEIIVNIRPINLKVAGPTYTATGQSLREEKKAAKGPISSVATAFESSLGQLTKVPVVGPYAAVGQGVAKSIGKLASMFGFSRPCDNDQHTTFGYTRFAQADGNDQFRKLALDSNNITDITKYSDISDTDSLSYANIIGRESALVFFTLGTNNQFIIPVTPSIRTGFTGTGADFRINLPILAFTSLCFKYWRGTIKYKIRVICSKYHRAKLRLSWNPRPTIVTDDILSSVTVQNMLIDIDCSTTIEVDVHWGVNQPYLPCSLRNFEDSNEANGGLTVKVLNSTAPTEDAPIYFLVSYSAGDDFEFAVPHNNDIARYTPVQFNATTGQTFSQAIDESIGSLSYPTGPLTATSYQPYNEFRIDPFYGIGQSSTDVAQSNVAKFEVNLGYMGDEAPKYMGEKYNSFRPVLKRHSTTQLIKLDHLETEICSYTVPSFPLQGYQDGAYSFPLFNSFISHFSLLFRGYHGSMRMNLIPLGAARSTQILVGRAYDYPLCRAKKSTLTETQDEFNEFFDYQQLSGIGLEPFNTVIGQQVSVSMPWQWPYNFLTTNGSLDIKTTSGHMRPVFVVTHNDDQSVFPKTVMVTHAIGEDFNYHLFTGVPTLYVRGQYVTV